MIGFDLVSELLLHPVCQGRVDAGKGGKGNFVGVVCRVAKIMVVMNASLLTTLVVNLSLML